MIVFERMPQGELVKMNTGTNSEDERPSNSLDMTEQI